MKLYDKLKNLDLVENYKDFFDLIHIRALWINNKPVDDPNCDVIEIDKIKIGILEIV